MPIYGTFILLNTSSYLSYTIFPVLRNTLYIVVLFSTFLMPAITFLFMLRRKQIDSLEMQTRAERNMPYISTLLFYLAGWYLLNKLPLPRAFGNILLDAAMVIFIAFLINLRWKISIHMLGLGGLAGLLFAFATMFTIELAIPLALLMAVAGITGTARMYLDAHIPSQIYAGFLIGFCVEWLFVYIVI